MVAPRRPFHEVLEDVSRLDPAAQSELIDIVKQRLIQHERDAFLSEVHANREAVERGKLGPASVDDIMRELES